MNHTQHRTRAKRRNLMARQMKDELPQEQRNGIARRRAAILERHRFWRSRNG